uniref:EF-hand domain-containing protein n=1 Tax=Populus alba TaxID=43335 RepID=A0A4U5NAZ2_POPAL|nr:hypothetical protein D5086_0000272020 [Populus alba]
MGFAVNNPKGEEGNNCLTKEQLKSFFLKHDNNHDNHLSRKELRQAFDELGAFSARYRAARGLSHADGDKDGQIDMVELDDLVNYAYKLGFRIWVKTLDADKDGKISKDELADAVRGNGGWFAGWKGKMGVKAADANGNGVIDDSEIDMLACFCSKALGVS